MRKIVGLASVALLVAACGTGESATVEEAAETSTAAPSPTETETPETGDGAAEVPDFSDLPDSFDTASDCIESIPIELVLTYDVDPDAENFDDIYSAAVDACDTLPDTAVEDDTPSTGSIGDGATVEDETGTLGTITVSDVRVTTSPESDYGDAPSRGYFVIFSVDLEAEATFSVYEDDFYIRDADGNRTDQGDGNAFDAVDYDDTLGYAELNAGEKKSGLVVFDTETLEGELAYAPNFEGGPIVIWEFSAE